LAIRAVLFDVGGPIDTEVLHEQLVDRDIRLALAAAGIEVTPADLLNASEWAVSVFAPDAYTAMIWRLSAADPARAAAALAHFRSPGAGERRAAERGGIELRPGIPELLRRLHSEGLLLGLAANQPPRALADLDRLGLGGLFRHRELTANHGYRKPDVRLFLRACEDLGVAPGECIMVGDRIDNDIAPARLLGMATVLLRTGRHINQQPRSLDEIPDVEAQSVERLESAIWAVCRER
jgi:HAD superfamily hydrolase (TIGR01509 family)